MEWFYFYAAASVAAFIFSAFTLKADTKSITADILVGLFLAALWPLFIIMVILNDDDNQQR